MNCKKQFQKYVIFVGIKRWGKMKLLVSDIDGTIYRNYKVDSDIKNHITDFINEKNVFILAMGRNFVNFL